MKIKPVKKKMNLYGFNNLTKTLSFNFYDLCYARTSQQRVEYLEYIDEEYNGERLTNILTHVAAIIGANILNIAMHDYEPQGASVTILISENGKPENGMEVSEMLPMGVVAHLDKSHLTVHTYPESHPHQGISTFRADIDISTCGEISPLLALNYLIDSFQPDIAAMDYRVRGFTRDTEGKKLFLDHKITSIQNFVDRQLRSQYQMVDINVYDANIFHTSMILRQFKLDNYLFGTAASDLDKKERQLIKKKIKREMIEIYAGRQIY
ncbi:MAG: adenosylmethionine decarboxylase [Methylocystaceae bacterium]